MYSAQCQPFHVINVERRVGHDMIQKIGYHDIISLFRDRDMELFTFFYVIYDLDMIWRFSEKIISYHWISPKPGTEKYPFSIVVQDLQFSSNRSFVMKQLLFFPNFHHQKQLAVMNACTFPSARASRKCNTFRTPPRLQEHQTRWESWKYCTFCSHVRADMSRHS